MLRRRLSKKNLTGLLLFAVIIYHLLLIIYDKLSKPVTVELINNVVINHNEDLPSRLEHSYVKEKKKRTEESKSSSVKEKSAPLVSGQVHQEVDHDTGQVHQVNDHDTGQLQGQKSPAAGQLSQNAKYMENVLSKMEKKMKQDEPKIDSDFAKLPSPQEMLNNVRGPVPMLRHHHLLQTSYKRAKILVIAREHTGFPVLGQFFTPENDFFEHGEPPEKLETVQNLLNCILVPDLVNNFHTLVSSSDFGDSSYFRQRCLQDSDSVCDDPLSYENKCSSFSHQVIRSKHFSTNFVSELLSETEDINVVYLVRDPRAVLKKSKLRPQQLCSQLSQEWDVALHLKSMYPSRFIIARYEELAVTPVTEVINLMKYFDDSWNISLTNNEAQDQDWSVKRNSLQQVNNWKSSMDASQLNSIENACSATLSKMEYQSLGVL